MLLLFALASFPLQFSPRASLQVKEVGKVKIAILHNAEKKRLEVVVTRFDELDKAEFGDSPSTYVRLCLLPDEDTKVSCWVFILIFPWLSYTHFGHLLP